MVTGPPGAGKSSVAALVVASFDATALVPGDAFFSFWSRGAIPPWLPEADEQNAVALRAAAAAAGTFAAGECTVVYDGVLIPRFLPLFAEEVSRRGMRGGKTNLHYAVLLPSVQQCQQRVAGRIGHGFTDMTATARMHADFVGADVEPRHVIADPPPQPRDVAQLLLQRYADGLLRY